MDKTLAKKTDNILFVKIDNDGFDLGAQRRAIDKNDLTGCLELLQQYKEALQNNVAFESDNKNVFLVEKKKIAAKDDYNLSIDRYRINENVKQSKFEMVSVEDLIDDVKYSTKIQKSEFLSSGKYPIIDQSEKFIAGYWNNENDVFKISKPLIVFGDHTRIFKFVDFDFVLGADGVKLLQPKEIIDPKFFYYCLNNLEIINLGYSRHYKELKEQQIPLPPLSIQQQIVSKIESCQAIINGAKQVVENYKPQIEINADWEMVELGEVCEVKSGGTPSRDKDEYWNGNIPWIKTGQIDFNKIYEAEEFITEEGLKNSSTKMISKGTVLMAMYGQGITRGRVAVLEIDATINQACAAIIIKSKKINNEFLFQILISMYEHLRNISDARGGNQSNLNAQMIKELSIPLPTLSEQQQIVNRIEQEQQLVNANKELIKIFEQKIKDEINKLWSR